MQQSLCGGGFWAGTQYEANRIRQNPAALFQRDGAMPVGNAPSQGGRPDGAGGTMGSVASVEGNVVTITKQDGSSVRVQIAESTLIEKNMTVTLADLTVGEQVIVSGTANEDGSITARSIQSLRGMAASAPAEQ
jgi:hypothetical protein